MNAESVCWWRCSVRYSLPLSPTHLKISAPNSGPSVHNMCSKCPGADVYNLFLSSLCCGLHKKQKYTCTWKPKLDTREASGQILSSLKQLFLRTNSYFHKNCIHFIIKEKKQLTKKTKKKIQSTDEYHFFFFCFSFFFFKYRRAFCYNLNKAV